MSRTLGIYRAGNGDWVVDKVVHEQRLRERFNTERDAKEWLALQVARVDRLVRFGDTPRITFAEAVDRRLKDKLATGMRSAESDAEHLKVLLPFVGDLRLDQLNDASFDAFRRHREAQGRAAKTIHLSLSAAQSILNDASAKWRTPHTNLPYLTNPPRLSLPRLDGAQRRPRPINWEEEARLEAELPSHLKSPVSFAINTGARDDVIVNLRWQWLVDVPKFNLRVAVVPAEHVKGGGGRRVLVLNRRALEAIEAQRGRHSEYVFVCPQRVGNRPSLGVFLGPVQTLNNTAWQSARRRAGLSDVRVHDLRHTFAGRLAAAGASEDIVAALLWHGGGGITQHYMGKQLLRLQAAVDSILEPPEEEDISILTLIEQHDRTRPSGG